MGDLIKFPPLLLDEETLQDDHINLVVSGQRFMSVVGVFPLEEQQAVFDILKSYEVAGVDFKAFAVGDETGAICGYIAQDWVLTLFVWSRQANIPGWHKTFIQQILLGKSALEVQEKLEVSYDASDVSKILAGVKTLDD